MKLPVHDWQFWIVSALSLAALLYLLREVLPARLSPFASRRRGRATTLTVKGKTREKK